MKKIISIIIIMLHINAAYSQLIPWYLTGNTPVLGNFLGSTNAADVNFRTANLQRMTIIGVAGANQGFIGMNNTAPIFNLTIGANGPYPPNPGPYPDGGIIALGGINLGSEKLIFEIS
ncbi:MAG: hypothetical protein IPO27_09685 [Bacteroidetes bacterium]|nr:hypothetical protein [Bacteroidota bacterium]